jgi:hypothetical protein
MSTITPSQRAGVEYFTSQFYRMASMMAPGVRWDVAFDPLRDAYRLRGRMNVQTVDEGEKIYAVDSIIDRLTMESYGNDTAATEHYVKNMVHQLDAEVIKHTQPPADVGALLLIAQMTARYDPRGECFNLYWETHSERNRKMRPGPGNGVVGTIEKGRPLEAWQAYVGAILRAEELKEQHPELMIELSQEFSAQFYNPIFSDPREMVAVDPRMYPWKKWRPTDFDKMEYDRMRNELLRQQVDAARISNIPAFMKPGNWT